MGKRKGKQQAELDRNERKLFNTFLQQPTTLLVLQNLPAVGYSATENKLLCELNHFTGKDNAIEDVIEQINRDESVQSKDTTVYPLIRQLFEARRQLKRSGVSHMRKHRMANALGLFQRPWNVLDVVHGLELPFPFKLVERSRQTTHAKRGDIFDEVASPGTHLADASTGYYVVGEDESIIFYSFTDEARLEIEVELVVLRNVGTAGTFSPQMIGWFVATANEACNERRNVRPTHGGEMVQLGLNLGPRHARVLGWAKSFTKDLDTGTKVQHDEDAVGVISIIWSMLSSLMPREVLDEVDDQFASYGLPRLATRNIAEDRGFHVRSGDDIYMFPAVERAPPEAYMSRGYHAPLHTDSAYCRYTLTYCFGRHIEEQMLIPQETAIKTRSASRKAPVIRSEPPPGGGSSFVDPRLRVVVRQAVGTAMAIQSGEPHATTVTHGAVNTGVTIPFSTRLIDAWTEALALGNTVQIVAQAGVEGNHD